MGKVISVEELSKKKGYDESVIHCSYCKHYWVVHGCSYCMKHQKGIDGRSRNYCEDWDYDRNIFGRESNRI